MRAAVFFKLCDARVGLGGAWSSDERYCFCGPRSRTSTRDRKIRRDARACDADTRAAQQPTSLLACFLPGSDRFLYFINRTGPEDICMRPRLFVRNGGVIRSAIRCPLSPARRQADRYRAK